MINDISFFIYLPSYAFMLVLYYFFYIYCTITQLRHKLSYEKLIYEKKSLI